MNIKKKPLPPSLFQISLSFCGFFLVPAITLLVGLQKDPNYTNFTHLATLNETQLSFFIWAFICIITECTLLYSLFKTHLPLSKFPFFIIPSFLVLSVITPYSNGLSFFGLLHLLFSYLAFFSFNSLLFFIFQCFSPTSSRIKPILLQLYIITLSLSLYFTIYYSSITSLVEIIYMIGLSITLTFFFIFSVENK